MVHPEVFPTPVELTQFQSHGRFRFPGSVGSGRARVFPAIKQMAADVVLRGAYRECPNSSKKNQQFWSRSRLFREVPGKVPRSGYAERFWLGAELRFEFPILICSIWITCQLYPNWFSAGQQPLLPASSYQFSVRLQSLDAAKSVRLANPSGTRSTLCFVSPFTR